ncbi:ubiquitin-protein ligase, putative [Ricinus communis]|uniref:Ubiquitin-protein ligase, putative n=1 Tax=Ricinus communis TaxID=3988 RepID=B9R9Y3_RICCO|nr:ubiquitin-protein ligase, putative [Ricinus communis]|eukprot:XP_002511008.1 protein ARABIDILLO 1 [Ricinus communis]
MTRKVRRKLSHLEKNKDIVDSNSETSDGGCLNLKTISDLDWTALPDDTAIQLFSYLNYRDQASLSSTCRTFRLIGSSPCLWESLDLRSHKFDIEAAASLSSRSKNLRKLRFRGAESADAVIQLQARGLREISGDFCRDITDATVSVIAARHEMLESLQLGPNACERISSDAIKAVALCCPNLKRLQLSGVREVRIDAINALARHCGQLLEVAFMESDFVDEVALGNLASVQFLSIAGTRNVKWGLASQVWSNLPKLVGLDVSRTDISLSSVRKFLSLSKNLKVLFAFNCPVFEAEVDNDMVYVCKGKILLTVFNDIFKAVASLFVDTTKNGSNAVACWRKLKIRGRSLDEKVVWIEWVLSHSLLRIAENNPKELDVFWLKQGAKLLLHLLQSSEEDVQERAATAIATFVVIDDENATIDSRRAEAIVQNGGIQLLLDHARSCQEGLQSEAAKAIANLSVDSKVAKAVAEIGGIKILANLARSMNRLVAEEAAGGLWNLSVGEEHKGAIAEAGGIKALVDLIFKWPSSSDGVVERAAGALANLAADDKCSMEVAMAGGVHALVMLARSCKFEGVQEQAARALANLAAHGDSNSNNAAVGQEAGALEALVQLTCSQHEGVRHEAAGALWNLSFDDKNREAIAAAGGIVALVSLAQSCSNSSQGLQERAAGALWGLSVSEANSVAIGQVGGVAPLIVLARSDVTDVHETAAGALWNLAFNPGNALRIVEDGGVPALVCLCTSSLSKMARFMAALALAYVFDGRMDEIAPVGPGPSLEGVLKSVNLATVKRIALKHVEAFVRSFSASQTFATVLASSAPTTITRVAEAARIPEAGLLRCSAAEIKRFVAMLRNHSSILKACSAFALLQFTMPGGRHAVHHTSLLQDAGASRTLRALAAAASAPIETKVFAKIVLRNLEHKHL